MLDNRQGGVVQGQQVQVQAGTLDNSAGRMAAQTGDVRIRGGNLINAGGGLYAKGLVRVDGLGLDNNGGQLAGNRVELALGDGLSNRSGVIESDTHLLVSASTVDNQGGVLRALGGAGKSDFQVRGGFDNRNGKLEAGSTDLTLNAAGLNNLGGSVLHGGNGTFDITTANVSNAGGNLVTRGGLTLTADSWTNGSVIQAGRLTLNINTLEQAATGQLLASESLVGNGVNWNNAGKIISDGSASLNLSGTYTGSGRYSSLGNLGLQAGQLTLDSTGSIAGGAETTLLVSGALINAGRLTSAQNLNLSAGALNNSGTLGAGKNLQLSTGTLLNEHGLLYSGADMQLLASTFTNRYAQVYSFGNLLIGADKDGGKMSLLDNRSSGIESGGQMTLAATTLNNVRDVLEYSQHEKADTSIERLSCTLIPLFGCDPRDKGRINGYWLIHETDRLEISQQTEAASINSGSNLTVNAGSVTNSASSISAAGNITVTASTITNQGVQAQEIRSSRWWVSYVDYTYGANYYAGIFNSRNNPNPSATFEADLAAFMSWVNWNVNESREIVSGASLDAVIQAGGNITLNATQNINNSVVRPWYSYIAAGAKTADTGAGSAYSTAVSINSQLPPNLAQQYINPLTLPGVGLPDEKNSLYRINKEGAGTREVAVADSGPRNWTLGAASIDLGQREQAVPVSSGRTLQLDDITQLSADSRQLTVAARQASGISATATSIDVAALGTVSNGTWQSGRSEGGDLTRADGIGNQGPGGDPSGALSAAGQNVDLPGISGTRDTRIEVTTPGSNTGLSTGDRGTTVGSNQQGTSTDIPDLAPGGRDTQIEVGAQNGQGVPGLSTGSRDTTVAGQGSAPDRDGASNPALNVPGLSTTVRDTTVAAQPGGNLPPGRDNPVVSSAHSSLADPLLQQAVVPAAERPGTPSLDPGSTAVIAPATSQPTPTASQTIERVQGVPERSTVSQSHKYLVETNPVLTELKQFMSSDYLLAGLGYNPDDSAKRLGDGFYEQHLIQQAIVAGTGQRFLAGMTSNEQMFKYLMDNAIASRQQLNLTVGVSLTAEQVAALTHDIVWLEEMQVNGETVLVPVLYMANANNRLAANGALIAGTDVNLIAGQDLVNVGTLRASNNLSAMAGNDLVNSGLIEAANRVDLLAGNNIVNKAGGIISGRDVSLTTVLGDVINERSVTSHISGDAANNGRRDFLDSAARIEAANDLSINAGQDILNQGGVLQSGRDLGLQAGRDVLLGSTEAINSQSIGRSASQSIQQNGSSVTAGRDLSVAAGRDFTAIASQIEAQRDIDISATGDVTLMSAADEEHSSYTSKKLKTREDHVSQVSTTLKAGGDVAVSAGEDLALMASRITAGDEAYLFAGDNVRMTTADNVDYSYYEKTKKGSFGKKKSTMTETETDVSVSSSVSSGTKLVISAGEDFNATGARLSSDGALLVTAGGDINLDAAQDYASQANASSKKSWTSSKSSSSEITQTRLNGTELVGESIELKADNDIVLKAAALRAEEGVKLTAGNDVLIGAAQETQTSAQSKGSSKAGFTVTGWLSSTQKSQQSQSTSSQSTGSAISAGSIQIRSGSDTTVEGSTLVADKNIGIDAGGNLEIISAANTEASTSKSGSKKVGEIGTSWWQGATGVLKQKQADEYSANRQSGSQIASLGGNINLTAGDHYTQTASQLVAPEGDIGITARHVDIQAGYDSMEYSKTTSTSRTAIGGTVSIPLLDALRNVQQMGEAAQKTSDGRMVALAAVNAAMSANQAVEAGQALMEAPQAGIKVSVNLSDSRSHSESSQSGRNVVSSDVVAGGNVKVVATGDGANSDINGIGSRIEGGGDVILKADGDINLVAAQNTAHQESNNRNSGWSAGIGIGFGGAQNGISFELAANAGRGMADGDDVTQTNTYIKGGNSVKLESGGDTTIKGGVVSADQVKVRVGGDLNIESLQDTSTYTSRQMSAGVGVSICVPPFCAGMSSVSGGVAAEHMQSDYASVNEQSGIKAGNGGFQVEVAGNTDLKGAIIASTDKAVADGKNTLETGTLTTSSIKNKAEYDASSINLSGGYGGDIGLDGKGNANAMANANGPTAPSKDGLSVNTPVVLYAGDSSSSTTDSGISGAAVTITNAARQSELTGQTAEQTVAGINTDVASDRDGSNKLKPIFDAQEISVNFEIVGKFVQNVSQYIASRAQEIDQKKEQAEREKALMNAPGTSEADQLKHLSNYQALKQEIRDIDENWGAGGTYRQIATALVAGISGNVAGSGGQFAQNMVVNYVQQQGSAYIGELVKKGLKEGSPEHAALHAIVGCAGAAASNQGCSSGALGGAASSVLAGLFAEADANETAVEREAKRNLITSLVTGIAAMSDPNGAATANNAATANIDNNWLSTQQYVQYQKELEEAQDTLDHLKVIAKWSGTSVKQDALTAGGIGLGLAESGLQDIQGLAQFLSDPLTGLQGLASVVSNPEVRAQLGEAATASLLGSIDRMKLAIETGGDDQAVQLGRDLGSLIYTVGGVATAVGGAAKAGLSLAKAGVEVSSKSLGKMVAKDGEELGERIAALEIKTTKSLDVVADGKGAGAKGPVTGSPSGETKVVGDGKPAANDGSFAGEKGPAAGSPSGETKVVGDGRPAANDASSTGAKTTDGGAEKVDDIVASSSKPEWLQRLDAGNEFNKVQSQNYPYNEVYIQRPDGKGYYRVDSYNPIKGEIVSRKLTQLSEVSEATAKSYISEAVAKYPAGATIAKVPSSGSLGGQKLQGTVILEVPPQNGAIPKSILDSANKAGVLIRDTNGRVY
ncbi:hemagglutinin repeat-containing protein [Pseudomonas bharatica]|uniref:hemagglutinin repeat-containing protein n=1 Tax=Pseudomonas bharatica TaxID=2692112 RepID=UPI001F047A28|nr:hemagglutinin repeat-containing protein [Pseudomonas bharatica]